VSAGSSSKPGRVAGAGRRRISSGGPWEERGGYSRAIAIGDACWVAGTTDAGPDGRSLHPDDIAGQARATLAIIERALSDAGFAMADVVRTRLFVTDISRWAEVLAIHGEVFGEIRPAATMVEVAALIDPTLLIEIEADAHRA
jgi:enamine deaminase RidA (YjgF/YER057c/UK114 family)